LLDLIMPGKSGIEVLEDIQCDPDDDFTQIPIIVMSSSTDLS